MSAPAVPAWLFDLLGVEPVDEGGEVSVNGHRLEVRGGVVRVPSLASASQEQTSSAFDMKWKRRSTYDSPASLARMREWLVERYGDVEHAGWWADHGERPVVLDAGCGAAFSAIELFGSRLDAVRYVGSDISGAVDVAAERFAERGHEGAFLQADLMHLPLAEGSVDVAFSEGVLHHTDSTEAALYAVARLVKPGGRFLLYVYKRKGPVREFTDDHVRELLQAMSPDEAWEALMPLTRLGKALGDLDVEVDVPEDVELLGIPAGRIPLQRLFYWHVVKAFHHPDLDLDELNHINYDWFMPRNAHRQSPEEVRAWCEAVGLEVERERVEEAGITVVARKRGG